MRGLADKASLGKHQHILQALGFQVCKLEVCCAAQPSNIRTGENTCASRAFSNASGPLDGTMTGMIPFQKDPI